MKTKKELTFEDTFLWNNIRYVNVSCKMCDSVGRIRWDIYQAGDRNICSTCYHQMLHYKNMSIRREPPNKNKNSDHPEFDQTYRRKIDGRLMIKKQCPDCDLIKEMEFTKYVKQGNKRCRSCAQRARKRKK